MDKDYPEDIQVKLKSIYKWTAKFCLFCVGVIKVDEEAREVDYSKFLGPGYKSPKDFNTIVTNHSSYIDIIYLCTRYFTSFVSKKEIGDSALGVYSNGLKTIYYDRSKGKESAELCVS